jgi:hypothetical protein
VIDTDKSLDEALGALVGRDEMLAEIARLLDEGAMDLDRGGAEFPFALSTGYAGFNDPEGFAQFNRAMRARVAVYQKSYSVALTALAASFLDESAGSLAALQAGVYHTYSTQSGDQVNNLTNRNIYAHPSFVMNAEVGDLRVTRKTRMVAGTPTDPTGSAQGLSSNFKYTIYTTPESRVAIIRNEELLLLRAEARFFTGNGMGAMADLNRVRTISGGLMPIAGIPVEMAFVDALLYERRYSLTFEGHRWIDLRRFGRALPLDMPTGEDPAPHVRNVRYPIPLAECDARPGEVRCDLGSM